MPSLKAVQKVVPNAVTLAGRVIAFHNGKHVDLGAYVGDDAVALSKDGEALMAAEDVQFVEVAKPRRKLAPNINAKPEAGLDLSKLDV